MYLRFITRVKEGNCAKSLVKCELLEKENDYALFLTGWIVGKEQVQGKVKQHFLYNLLLWNPLSLNLRTANTKTAPDEFGEKDITHSIPGAALEISWPVITGSWEALSTMDYPFFRIWPRCGKQVGLQTSWRSLPLELWCIPLSMPLAYTVNILAGVRKYEGYMDIWLELVWKTLCCVNKQNCVIWFRIH